MFIILLAITNVFQVNPNKFHFFCWMTDIIFMKHYPWFLLPTTAGKILFHRLEIIKNCIVPQGFLSEGAQESRNRDIKIYRIQNIDV